MYIKCPQCEINYIDPNKEKVCFVCAGCIKSSGNPKTLYGIPINASPKNWNELVRGTIYGTVAQDIYKECSKKFGWDYSQNGKFAKQQKLYAESVLNSNKWGVWFWAHNNMTGTIQKNEKWRNEISGDYLYMYFSDDVLLDYERQDGRIVFAKDNKGNYIFLGCYTRIDQDIKNRKDTYKLVSSKFPFDM